ncbi:MAG: START-like domain-containing protein [Bacteroidia bacterium]
MAQKAKNQKGKKDVKKAKTAHVAKHAAPAKAKKGATLTKIVKSSPKLNGNASKKALPLAKNQSVKLVKPGNKKATVTVAAPKVAKSNTIQIPVKASKGHAARQPVMAVKAITKLPANQGKPADSKPVDGAKSGAPVKPAAAAKKPAKAPKPKKIFRSEMIFPNQLKETPLLKVKNKPEPKGKFVLEFAVKSSPALLFDFLSTPSGLSEWFADDVDIRNQEFTFHWDGQIQRAKLLAFKQDQLMRMRWFDKNEEFYFEFRIDHDDLTGDVTLIVTDFGESDDDIRTSRLLWESQVNKLLKVLGAY